MNDDAKPDAVVPGYEYARVAAAIEELIKAGKLKPGDRLPSLVELGEQYDVARNTAQKAVIELRKRGLVQTVLYKGTFIAAPKARPES